MCNILLLRGGNIGLDAKTFSFSFNKDSVSVALNVTCIISLEMPYDGNISDAAVE